MQEMRGTFMKSIGVKLGDLLTDADGRLIVLGGHGTSQSVPSATVEDFADNDGWCDDTSDGPVRATVRLHNTAETISADPAWVVVAPPDFAPAIENLVTLYDAGADGAVRQDARGGDATTVSFKDISHPAAHLEPTLVSKRRLKTTVRPAPFFPTCPVYRTPDQAIARRSSSRCQWQEAAATCRCRRRHARAWQNSNIDGWSAIGNVPRRLERWEPRPLPR